MNVIKDTVQEKQEKMPLKLNKRPTGLNGHLHIRDYTLTSYQKDLYLHINRPIIE